MKQYLKILKDKREISEDYDILYRICKYNIFYLENVNLVKIFIKLKKI